MVVKVQCIKSVETKKSYFRNSWYWYSPFWTCYVKYCSFLKCGLTILKNVLKNLFLSHIETLWIWILLDWSIIAVYGKDRSFWRWTLVILKCQEIYNERLNFKIVRLLRMLKNVKNNSRFAKSLLIITMEWSLFVKWRDDDCKHEWFHHELKKKHVSQAW